MNRRRGKNIGVGEGSDMLKRLQVFTVAAAVSAALAACGYAVGNHQDSGLEHADISGEVTEDWKVGSQQALEESSSDRAGIVMGHYESVTAEDLFQARNPYIGNASGTGKLIQMTKAYFDIQEENTMELQTTAPPYSLMLHFKKEPDRTAMQKAAAVLIGLIDNCSSVTWDYPTDGDGNRESCYLSNSLAGQMLDGDRNIKGYGESADGVSRMLSLADGMSYRLQPKDRTDSLDTAVSAAIVEYNRPIYLESEAAGEGHLILETEEKEDEVIVYALTRFGTYQFQDGNFVKSGGSGAIPAVITLHENGDGSLWWKWYQMPQDGGEYQDSIRTLFPESLWDVCMTPDSDQLESLAQQEREDAAEYLKSIGRQAKIGEYRDFPHPLLTEQGVSVDVSNKLSECGRNYPDSPAAYGPSWIGNVERLEDGVRYVYACDYDEEQKEIIYSKTDYAAGQLVGQIVFDSVSGEVKEAERLLTERNDSDNGLRKTKENLH